jgi:hypothetical protein
MMTSKTIFARVGSSAAVIALGLLVAGCPGSAYVDKRICVENKTYSAAQQKRAAKEYETAGPETRALLRDYRDTRRKNTECLRYAQ